MLTWPLGDLSELALIIAIWIVFWAYWLLRARGNAATEKARALVIDRIHQITMMVALAVMLGALEALPYRGAKLFDAPAGLGIGLTISGLAFSVWAREYLGQYWSGAITKKHNHQIIQSGPYAIVRHPIYSGFLIASFGTMIANARPETVAAMSVFWLTYVFKVWREDAWLKSELGAPYVEYARRVKGLIPGVI